MLLPDGTWVLGPGDASPEIRKIKGFMRVWYRSYAGHLADTELYDEEMYLAVLEMERRLVASGKLGAADGFIGYNTKIAMGYLKPDPPKKPIIHTVCGTGVRGDFGPDADVGRWLLLNGIADWQWTGYPARPFPMWSSVLAGVTQLATDINVRSKQGTQVWLCGYSQGAIVCSLLWKYHINPPNGQLHHRINDFKRAFMFANPMRQEGVGGAGAGALEDRLENTPSWWREYAHPKDIYSSVPVASGWGENVRAITKIIMGNNWWTGRDSIFAQLLELGINPFNEGWAVVQSVLKAGLFFASGTGPHTQGLPVPQAIDYLRTA